MSKKEVNFRGCENTFNEKGYSQVTIRMIALKVNMSSGNLNYHYKKREDIFEALYFDMVAAFDERINRLADTEISIEQIKIDVERSMRRMLDYTFFGLIYTICSL
ncbi:MAG: TetR/AcrR family transcriptional regulator [Chitinophagales bacterium]